MLASTSVPLASSPLQYTPRPEGAGSAWLEPSLPSSDAEEARLEALRTLEILDTPPESEFDDILQLAAAICGSPIGMISLVDENRQWFKAVLGCDLSETPREVAFCHHAIQQPGLMLVEDATEDARFRRNPMVTGESSWRFYAGVPVEAGGHAVGTLCIVDRIPRSLTSEQQSALRILARQVNARLELRAQKLALEHALASAQAAQSRAETIEQRFQAFMDAGPFLAYIKDEAGRMLYYNEPMARIFQVSRTAMLQKSDAELWPPELAALYREHDLEVLRRGKLQVSQEQTRQPDGSTAVWRSYKFPCADASGQALVGGISVEVTDELRRQAEVRRYQAELEATNRRLSELASVDALTGIANRRSFDEQIRMAFRRARQSETALSVLMLDVDHFKLHNDRFGHAHGDDVLRLLAKRLSHQLRANDLLARYGGEEFVILLTKTSGTDAMALARRLLEGIRTAAWPSAPVTVSIGLSTLNPATRDPQHLIGRADEALYAAKCAGRDQVVSYADELSRLEFAFQPS